jgi:type IV pilus secretin PilQ/predicted competence protein
MKKQFLKMLLVTNLGIVLFSATNYSSASNKITINFYHAELKTVLETLSRETGINLISSTELGNQPVSIYMENVDKIQAVDAILDANGLFREKISGTEIYVVKKITAPIPVQVPAPPLLSQVFFLKYAKAEDLGKIVSSFASKQGHIIVDSRTNSITVRDTKNNLKELETIILQLDKIVTQVSIEAVLVEISDSNLSDLGIHWNLEGNFIGPSIDTPFPWSKKGFSENIVSGRAGTSDNPQFMLGSLSFQNLTASLKILQSEGKANILANPKITTLNDKTAEMKIIKNMAVAPKMMPTDDGRLLFSEYEYRDVGVTLKVTPKINEEGFIVMEVEPIVSSAVQSSVFTSPPAVDTYERKVKTSVLIKDGSTLVIGGLTRQDSTKTTNKVPLLGDILPFLFSNKTGQKEKVELVIFITPRIVNQDSVTVFADEEIKRMLPEN